MKETGVRVILRTPAEIVAEYDLPDVGSGASDEEILAAAAAAEPLQRSEPEVVGAPYVYARGLDDLAQQGRRLMQADSRLDDEKKAAQQLARRYFEQGRSKRDIAQTLGITRMTLDVWLGDRAPRSRKRTEGS
ncbi:MAG: hypothetical protein CK429_32675 [Mycobacterium sp.]|nr:MAG: hypothetical protein CK429_32675 [Mycobacterium sp.]